jgi:AAA+ superfamily predicted ATPase
VNFQTDLSSLESFSDGSNTVSLTPRPQSVAQRILRERQERNITAKVPVTPTNTKTNKKSKEKHRQPLYLALKATAQKKNQTSKAELTEKIRQEAHLNAVKNYSVPPLPKEYHENMLKLQNNAFLSDRKENNNNSSKNLNGTKIKKLIS